MKNQDYQKEIAVANHADEVYKAITEHIADWWSNDLTGTTAHTGDSFIISFGKTQKTMDIVEAVPNKRVVWKCAKAYINMAALKNKSEWEGTTMIWTLTENGQGTTLTFLHEGLNQNFECYNVCEAGWDTFLASLERYLVTGKGTPNLKTIASQGREEKEQPVS